MSELKRIAKIAGALSDPGRLKTLLALRGEEACICRIVSLLGLSFPTVSRHVAILEDAGLVVTEKRGKWTYCRLPGGKGAKSALAALRWLELAAVDAGVGEIKMPEPDAAFIKNGGKCCEKKENGKLAPGKRKPRSLRAGKSKGRKRSTTS